MLSAPLRYAAHWQNLWDTINNAAYFCIGFLIQKNILLFPYLVRSKHRHQYPKQDMAMQTLADLSALSASIYRIPRAVSVAAAAEALDLSERTIRRRIGDGSIKAVRPSVRRVVIPASEIERLLKPIDSA